MNTKTFELIHTQWDDKDNIIRVLKEENYHNIFEWEDPPNTFYDWHTHPYAEVRWIFYGELVVGIKNQTFVLKPGDKLIVSAGTPHWAKTSSGVRYICGSKQSI